MEESFFLDIGEKFQEDISLPKPEMVKELWAGPLTTLAQEGACAYHNAYKWRYQR